MSRFNFKTIQLLVAAALIAFGLTAPTESNAQTGYECILDTEDGGTSMNTADTDAGADTFNTASNLACGSTAMAGADGENTAVGSGAMAGIGGGTEAQNSAIGEGAMAGIGVDSSQNTATGENSMAGVGDGSDQNTAFGEGAMAGIGTGSDQNTAVGQSAMAGVGDGIVAATAVGSGATANFSNSTALGTGATTTRANQMVYGTATETHTMPGVTSDASRNEQVGPLELITTDADGNLASDQGNTFGRIHRNKRDIDDNSEGVAMALSLQDPDLTGDERLGLKVGWGTFSGENAMGVTVAGVVMPDIGAGIRLGLAGGAAFGLSEGNVGGRAGFQLSW